MCVACRVEVVKGKIRRVSGGGGRQWMMVERVAEVYMVTCQLNYVTLKCGACVVGFPLVRTVSIDI